MDPSKINCLTSKDYVGCTSCTTGYTLTTNNYIDAGNPFSICYETGGRHYYSGEPRMRRLHGEP